jgi:YD repeat-containing protein
MPVTPFQLRRQLFVQNPRWKQTFQYDRYGNRRFNTDNNNTTTLGSCSQAVCNPLINTSDNRITKDQNGDQVNEYDYDKNGNLTRDAQSKKFTYDAENHQIKVETVDANGNPISTNGEYRYDGEGKRVKKTSNTETTIFVYNAGGKLVAEYSTQLATAPQVSYLTADHLGSPRVITDQNGAVTTRKDYAALVTKR